MIPRDNRKQTGGRGVRSGKSDRPSVRQPDQRGRGSGNAPVMGTVIGFAPASAAAPTPTPAMNERLLFAFQVLIGYTVDVQVGGANSVV